MIDTSTTKGKIVVQQAWIDGKCIISKYYINILDVELEKEVEPAWNWSAIDYYIKPQTVEEAAEASLLKNFYETRTQAGAHLNGFVEGAKWQKDQE